MLPGHKIASQYWDFNTDLLSNFLGGWDMQVDTSEKNVK
jgi:hypothetical protein